MANHGGISFLSEQVHHLFTSLLSGYSYFAIKLSILTYSYYILFQVSHHPPMSAGHAENEHFTYDVTSKLKTKLLGNSVDVYPVGR